MSLASAAYVGTVRHQRRVPAHRFVFPLFMVYLDLDEIDTVLAISRLWGRSRWHPARFHREDFLCRDSQDIGASVRACLREQTGAAPAGPIRVLTHLRYFGYNFNPVSFYYCFDRDGELAGLVAEITNTPWGERHRYALATRDASRICRRSASDLLRWRFDKDFHVSPFLPMDLAYDWTLSIPADSLWVHMNVHGRDASAARCFTATLRMERRELSPKLMRHLLVRFPLMTARVIARIHFEALRLWWKRAPVFAHRRSTKERYS